MDTIIFWVVVIFAIGVVGNIIVLTYMKLGVIGIAALIAVVILALRVISNAQKKKGNMQEALDESHITEITSELGKLLALCCEASGSYIGVFCVIQNGNLLLKAELRDSTWAYAMAHENDVIGQSSTTYGEMLISQFNDTISRCSTRHPDMNMGNFQESEFRFGLMADWDDGIRFEKTSYLHGSAQRYLSAIKSKVESSFPEYASIRISFIA